MRTAGSAAAVLYSAAVAAYETVAQWPFALDLLQAILPAVPGREALIDGHLVASKAVAKDT